MPETRVLLCSVWTDPCMSLEVLASGTPEELARPCVECGLVTGNFCDKLEFITGFKCLAENRLPLLSWVQGQRTPFCTGCEKKLGSCYFCRGGPCVECGLVTGHFCDKLESITGFKCLAENRIPSLPWVKGQRTPFRTGCEQKLGSCCFCRGVPSCTPFTRR